MEYSSRACTLVHIHTDAVLNTAVKSNLSVIKNYAPVTKLTNCIHTMADIKYRSAFFVSSITHFTKALLLKFHITNSQNFIHNKNL